MIHYLLALLCVTGMAAGQILFKISATGLLKNGLFSPQASIPLIAAIILYGITSVTWVWTLQKIDLGRIYPIMALAFVLVPIGSHLVFGERFQPQYFVGLVLIVTGIIIAVRA